MNEPLRVALVINSVLIAGAETVVLEIASHLNRETFAPTVYVLRDHGDAKPSLAQRYAQADVPLVFLSRSPLGIFKAARILRREFKQSRPHVVHCHLPDAVIAAGLASIWSRIPFIIHEHQTHRFHSWKIRLAYRFLRPLATLTLCYAGTVEEELFGSVALLKAPPERIARRSYTIRNGIDMDSVEQVRARIDRAAKRRAIGCDESALIIFSAARFVEWKGHRRLIEAFASIANDIPAMQLYIAGEGMLLEELRSRAAVLGLRDRFHLLGLRSDIYELLAISDIFSLVFDYPIGMDAEAVGVAASEAMAFGLPVIVGGYAGVEAYIQNGENGLVVSPRDTPALAGVLQRIAEDIVLRRKLGEAARAFAAHELSWNAIMPTYQRLYQLIARA